jgi:hypothetical protein
MTTRQKTVSLRTFLGLNKRDDPMELRRDGRGYELVEAKNVDITNRHKARRRTGYDVEREVATRKIWANEEVFVSVEGTNLVDVRDFDSTSNFRTDMHPTDVPGFAEVLTEGEVYYSDSRVNGKFVDGVHADWEVEQPPGNATLAAAGGSLYNGCYQVVVTYEHTDGRESGCGKSDKIELASNGGIALTNIPQPVDASITKINVYATEPDGTQLYKRASLAVGTASYTITSRRTGSILRTQFKDVPPRSTNIAYAGSRMVVAVDEFLLVSEPFTYHLFDYGEGFLTFPKPINLIVPTLTGVYISAGAMYFVNLSDESPVLKRVSKKPALNRTAFQIDADQLGDTEQDGVLSGWVAEDGIMIGTETGTVRNLTYDKIDIGKTDTASVMVKEANGLSQVVTSLKQPTGTNFTVTDVAIATVKKRNIVEDFNVVDPDGEPLWDADGVPLIYEE